MLSDSHAVADRDVSVLGIANSSASTVLIWLISVLSAAQSSAMFIFGARFGVRYGWLNH
jgi:hypothetical protein